MLLSRVKCGIFHILSFICHFQITKKSGVVLKKTRRDVKIGRILLKAQFSTKFGNLFVVQYDLIKPKKYYKILQLKLHLLGQPI